MVGSDLITKKYKRFIAALSFQNGELKFTYENQVISAIDPMVNLLVLWLEIGTHICSHVNIEFFRLQLN